MGGGGGGEGGKRRDESVFVFNVVIKSGMHTY